MDIEHGKIEGDLHVQDEFRLHGLVTGNIFVSPKGILHLHGLCAGNVYVEKDGFAYIHGTISKNLENRGGYIEVWGTITGKVYTVEGETKIDDDAVIIGKTVS
jgi:hypothetical protein